MIIKPSNVNLKFLTGLLNSKLGNFWFYHKGKRQGEQLQVDKNPLMELPIHLPVGEKEEQLQKDIVQIVDDIIETKRQIEITKLRS